jgi:two-component system sensor histidine kinase QseC
VSLRRRLLVYLLLCAPLVWAVALVVSVERARGEVNELFDTEIIRLARQVQVTLAGVAAAGSAAAAGPVAPLPAPVLGGEADLRDLAIAVWNAEGRLWLVDREGVELPRRPDAAGFVDLAIDADPWRVYYLQSPGGEWLVAAGQRMDERDELVWDLIASQSMPWLLLLPVLLLAMAWAVRQALAPIRQLTTELQGRGADELAPVPTEQAPEELQPLVQAMNGLFARIESTLERELAVLRAQWDVLRGASDDAERRQAEARLGAGLDRIDRLVTQMLALSRLEAAPRLTQTEPVDWVPIVEQVMSDVLPLAERRRIELACEWPADGVPAFPLRGDASLLAVLLRNLLDNAVRYAPEGSSVVLRFERAGLALENDGPPLPAEALARLGERFHRAEGQAESGSGLGVSIAQRVAALHGLALGYRARADGSGLVAELRAA